MHVYYKKGHLGPHESCSCHHRQNDTIGAVTIRQHICNKNSANQFLPTFSGEDGGEEEQEEEEEHLVHFQLFTLTLLITSRTPFFFLPFFKEKERMSVDFPLPPGYNYPPAARRRAPSSEWDYPGKKKQKSCLNEWFCLGKTYELFAAPCPVEKYSKARLLIAVFAFGKLCE